MTIHKQEVKELLRQTRRVLTFHQALGLEDYPGNSAIRKFIASGQEAQQPVHPEPRADMKSPKSRARLGLIQAEADHATLDDIRTQMGECTRCRLHASRTSIVFGSHGSNPEGPRSSGQPFFIAGDWPSIDDDRLGQPFCGEAGELLSRMLNAIGLSRDNVFITHVIKCLPPVDSVPAINEIKACLPFFLSQIAAVRPLVICSMGDFTARSLLGPDKDLLQIRGRFHDFHGIPLMPTFHPAYLIKYPDMKKGAWMDLKMIQRKLKAFLRTKP